jgi:hypothetical protein
MFQVPSRWDDARRAGARCARPDVTGLSTGFSHTVEFSRSLVGSPLRLSCRFPSQVPSPERRQPYSGPSRFVNRATYPLVPAGMPTVHLFVPVRSVPEASPSDCVVTSGTSGRPLVFPRDPLPSHRGIAVPTTVARSRYRYRDLWRHLATSTSYRSAVLCPLAQDGHRSRRNSVPDGSR